MTMKLCCSTWVYRQNTLEEAVSEIAAAGVTAVEWAVPIHLTTPSQVDAARAAADAHGLTGAAAAIYASDRDAVLRNLETAARLGAPYAILNNSAPTLADTAKILLPIVERAGELGVGIAFENHIHAIETIDQLEELLGLIPDANFGLALAPHHLVACGQDTAEAVRRLGKRTFVLYLWDVHVTKASGQVHYDWGHFPGSGDNDWPAVFAAVREVGFNRVFDLMWLPAEMPPTDEIRRRLIAARQYVQELLSGR